MKVKIYVRQHATNYVHMLLQVTCIGPGRLHASDYVHKPRQVTASIPDFHGSAEIRSFGYYFGHSKSQSRVRNIRAIQEENGRPPRRLPQPYTVHYTWQKALQDQQ